MSSWFKFPAGKHVSARPTCISCGRLGPRTKRLGNKGPGRALGYGRHHVCPRCVRLALPREPKALLPEEDPRWARRQNRGAELLGLDDYEPPLRKPIRRTPYFNQELPEFGWLPIAVVEMDGHSSANRYAPCSRCGANSRHEPCIAVEYIPRDRMRRAQEEKH